MKEENLYIDYLKKLKIKNLFNIIDNYNELATFFDMEKIVASKKKNELISSIDKVESNYIKNIIMTLDLEDLEVLKGLIHKNCDIKYLNEHNTLVNYLINKKILFKENMVVIPKDIKTIIKATIKNKKIVKFVKEISRIKNIVNGIVVAYGVIDKSTFEDILKEVYEIDKIYILINNDYKKEYVVESRGLVSTKLQNKKRINKYFENKNYKKFSIDEFVLLGECKYHYSIDAYKKLIKMLKSNYIFKKNDIIFVDKNIVIPYLYNSLNEEDIALSKLETSIIELFEFNGEKLKNDMLEKIKMIRNYFPLWEYRGYDKEKN